MTGISQIDLHIHTWYSDGAQSPRDILRRAADQDITTLAFADHDNMRGTREGLPIAAELGMELIPAIEVTCRWDDCDTRQGDRDIDVLGYWIDLDDPDFQAFETDILQDLHDRAAECCTRLTANGYPLTMADLLIENPRYGGLMQIVQAVQRRGYAADWDEAAPLAFDHWHETRFSRLTIEQAIAEIRHAGGVAILAHPTAVKCSGRWIDEKQLARLVAMGLDGIEIYHRRLDESARAYFGALAEQFDLLISGGSDFHGWWEGDRDIGTQPVTGAMVEAIRAHHCARVPPDARS